MTIGIDSRNLDAQCHLADRDFIYHCAIRSPGFTIAPVSPIPYQHYSGAESSWLQYNGLTKSPTNVWTWQEAMK